MDGTYELDRMSHLLARNQVKELSEVPAAVDRLVRDIDNYEKRSATTFPQEWKLPLLKQIPPEKHRKELEMRFSMGEKDFQKIVTHIVGYSNAG